MYDWKAEGARRTDGVVLRYVFDEDLIVGDVGNAVARWRHVDHLSGGASEVLLCRQRDREADDCARGLRLEEPPQRCSGRYRRDPDDRKRNDTPPDGHRRSSGDRSDWRRAWRGSERLERASHAPDRLPSLPRILLQASPDEIDEPRVQVGRQPARIWLAHEN